MSPHFHYDPEVDAAFLRFSAEKIVQSEEVSPGVILDFNSAGRMVAIEFLQASKRLPPDALR